MAENKRDDVEMTLFTGGVHGGGDRSTGDIIKSFISPSGLLFGQKGSPLAMLSREVAGPGQSHVEFTPISAGTQEKQRKDAESELRGRLEGLQGNVALQQAALGALPNLQGSILDKQLGDLLAEAGFQGGEQRQQIGESFSERGLSRSTSQQRNIAEQRIGEAAQKSEIIGGIEKQRTQFQASVDRIMNAAGREMNRAQIAKNLATIDSNLLGESMVRLQNLEEQGRVLLGNVKLDAANEEAASAFQKDLSSGIGSIFGTLLGGIG